MPQAITDGPLGLEARHRFTSSLDGTNVLMHDLELNTGFIFNKMPDFNSLGDYDNNTMPKTSRRGEALLPSQVRGRTFSAEGVLVAASAQGLRVLRSQLTRALGYRNGIWRIEPHPDYTVLDGHYWQAQVRVLEFDVDEDYKYPLNHRLGPYQLDAGLTVRINEGVWLWDELQDSGVQIGDYTAINLGNAPAEPVLTLEVPAGGSGSITIENQTVQQELVLTLPQVEWDVGGTLVINFQFRTITWQPTGEPTPVDGAAFLVVGASPWWGENGLALQPGNNDIYYSNADSIRIQFYHSHW